MARGLLAEGRLAEVGHMLAPLVAEAPPDEGQAALRTLLARVCLLREGDPVRALRLFEPLGEAARWSPAVAAEVLLWRGWAHAWRGHDAFDDARAVTLLDEAERRCQEALSPGGRLWALLGKALAYFGIDEYPLMRRALDQAAPLLDTLRDAAAERWFLDFTVLALRTQGRYAEALAGADRLEAAARALDDRLGLGHAHAYRALLLLDHGRPAPLVVAAADQAVALLAGTPVHDGYPVLAAQRARIFALLRTGAWEEAAQALEAALADPALPAAAAIAFQLLRVELLTRRGATAEAQRLLDTLTARREDRRSRLTAGRLARAQGALLVRRGEAAEGRAWLERAYQIARETGHGGQQLRALLGLVRAALADGDAPTARRTLHLAERYGDYFSLLPFAATRFHLLGDLAALEGRPEAASAAWTQALSAFSLTGDALGTARVQLALARLQPLPTPPGGPVLPPHPLAAAAHRTFSALDLADEAAAAAALLAAPPAPPAGPAGLAAALARASVSVELVAEAWLAAAEALLPGRWLGVYRHADDGTWHLVHEHGTPPAPLAFPDPAHERTVADGLAWLRLRSHPGPAFFFGTAGDRRATDAAFDALSEGLPVAALALDHALLRTRPGAGPTAALPDDGLPVLPGFVYAAPAMRELAQQLYRLRASHSPVLITGERGTGKELVARAVHALSERKEQPFRILHCAQVAPEHLERHLFGDARTAGALCAADGGTLFLDDVDALPAAVQPRLLRFLQEGEVFPVEGGGRAARPNVRLVAATTGALEALLRAGRFRDDLFYRLNVIPLRLPPLRERREEVPLLVRHFLHVLQPPGAPVPAVTGRAMDALLRYDWPGNVRQLRNEIERALALVGSEPAPTIDLADLSPALRAAPLREGPDAAPALQPGQDLDALLAAVEKAIIEEVLRHCDAQVTAAAERLGLSRQGLYKKMKRLGVDPARLASPTLHLN